MSNVAPTWDDFVAAYPAFTAYSVLGQQQLAISTALLSQDAWGDFYSNGIMLECAHNLVISVIASGSLNGALQMAMGPISSTSVAGTSTGFNSPSPEGGKAGSRDWYQKTSYGQQFLRLRNVAVPMGYVV